MKKRIILLISLLTVSLFGASAKQFKTLGADEMNTIYLNLTRIGLFEGEKGTRIESRKLENAVEFSAPVGSTLPGPDKITSTSGASFIGWVVPNDIGGLQKLTSVPSVAGLILQAHFANDDAISETTSGNSSSNEISTTEGQLQPGLYLKEIGQGYENAIHLTEGFSTVLNNTEYMVLNHPFESGFTFTLATPSDLSGLGDETLPSTKSNKGDIGYTLSSDNNKPNHTADYLKVNGNVTSSGPAQDGGYYYSFGNAMPGSLEFKVSGRFNIYITFWDNFGWARIYVEPA